MQGDFFYPGPFMPHGGCYLWTQSLIALHAISDAFIVLAYYSIPFTLLYFVRKRSDLKFHWIFVCFAAFVLACGTTHLMEIWNIWHGDYWLAGVIKAITALVSVPTALLLVKLIPRALAMPSAEELRKARDELEIRVEERAVALLQSEERFRTLFELAPDAIFLCDFEGTFVSANLAAFNISGYDPQELIGASFWTLNLISGTDLEQAKASLERSGRGEATGPDEYTLIKKDGSQVDVEIRSFPITIQNSQLVLGIASDITDRKTAEGSHTRLAMAVEQAAETVVITDTHGTILYVNPAFEKSTGYTREEAIGKNPRILKSDRQDADFYRRMWDVLDRGEVWQGQMVNRRKDGTLYEEEVTISPTRDTSGRVINYVAVKRDVTYEKQIEAQLRQSQKMEGVGQLAGGVAHDFNNILAVISMQAGLLEGATNLTPDQTGLIEELQEAVERAADLTRQLLIFGQRQTMQPRDLDMNDVVTNIGKMLQRILGEDVRMEFKFEPRPLFVHADAGMMDQVLMNLTVNARHAMPEGGHLVIETAAVEIDDLAAAQSPNSRPGIFSCLRVSDTGCGIAPENLSRIFEPFFTTKDVGKGTGLGLATVFGIVKQHNGWINVYSEVGCGTTFRIYLPRLLRSDVKEAACPAEAPPAGGTETILMVEDDIYLRELVNIALSRLGYRVLATPTGVAALEVWKQNREEISLLLTDLVMPDGVNGKELALRLLQERPGLKVIYASGYSVEIAGRDLLLSEGVNFLSKPFEAHKLARTVRAMLDA